jgi:hypothetical protein
VRQAGRESSAGGLPEVRGEIDRRQILRQLRDQVLAAIAER